MADSTVREAIMALVDQQKNVGDRLHAIEKKMYQQTSTIAAKKQFMIPVAIFTMLVLAAYLFYFFLSGVHFANSTSQKSLSLNMDLLQGIGAIMTGLGALWAASAYASKNTPQYTDSASGKK